ncbi:hypothetical protein FY034_17480 (plasmid) [Trichlorobacter lovleyi]|uniref:hypothetical protein n=1 Tax=Trichlorobacter lovleyi TaxID=313985 RepID=UPI00224010C5|nr:hypothetical protein [Trichlorobacter lovleyi]QOX80815.1 hypothetical protein FY034_17480 [Trichlorobacter lovleyi]
MLKETQISRATDADLEACAILDGILNDVNRGMFPRLPDGGYQDDDPSFFNPEDPSHLREFFKRISGCIAIAPGGVSRVVWGYHAILTSNLVDANKDHLTLHPRIERALEAYGMAQTRGC